MPKGLAIPFAVSASGGLATVDSDEQDNKIISLALGSDDNENAFQQNIGLGEDMMFDLADSQLRGKMIGRLRTVFANFQRQKRYKLVESSIVWSDGDGETILEFKYFNIESDEERTFRRTYQSNTGAR
jgi:hypothetical protein